MLTRRDLLKSSAVAGAGLFVAGYIDGLRFALPAVAKPDGYGPLQPDPAGLLDLPTGFRYDVVTQAGRPLAGAVSGTVPGRPDGTASFPGPNGGVYLVNNHEQSTGDRDRVKADADHTYDLKGPDGVVVYENFRPGKTAFLPYWRTSYGANNRMQKLNRDDSGKVLLLDYNKILADVVGPNARDNWPKHHAPRHSESINVLFMDGHTESRDPNEIDPRIRPIHEKLWRPTDDEKMRLAL